MSRSSPAVRRPSDTHPVRRGRAPAPPVVTAAAAVLAVLASGAVRPPTSADVAAAERPAASMAAERAGSAFRTHIRALVPRLLRDTGVPGASVALLVDGRLAYVEGFGYATDRVEAGPGTVFNAGSISKPLSAWGALLLAERGLLPLDAAVPPLVPGWTPRREDGTPLTTSEASGITIRRILSHTAGLSTPAVPEVPADSAVDQAVVLDAIRVIAEPGSGWSYSGGGYLLLERAIETATRRPFSGWMRDEVLRPLGMTRSAFGWPPDLLARAAVPHDGSRPVERRTYVGDAAAGLATTAEDLARFASLLLDPRPAASAGVAEHRPPAPLPDPSSESALPSPEARALMRTPAPATSRDYGLRYGLGLELWPLGEGGWLVGHAGQNIGWAGALWLQPETGDGLVVLTNDSDGRSVWRPLFCDWLEWSRGVRWQGICDRDPELPPPPRRVREGVAPAGAPGGGEEESRSTRAWLDSLLRARVGPGQPGAVIVVERDGVAFRAARGLADVAADRPLMPETPFYIASVAKPLTAALADRLVARGVLDWDDPLAAHLSDPPGWADSVRLADLRDQRSGIPDYYRFLEWARLQGLDNRAVLDTLRHKPREGGSRFAYSNSNYVLLALAAGSAAGAPYHSVLRSELADPLEMNSVSAAPAPPPRDRARGYRAEGEPNAPRFALSDYDSLRLPGGGPVVPLRLATSGAGGVWASAVDLVRFAQAVLPAGGPAADSRSPERNPSAGSPRSDRSRPEPGLEEMGGIPRVVDYRGGWFRSVRYGTEVWWADGDFAGFHSLLMRVPAYDFTLAVLANRRDFDARELGRRVADRFLAADGAAGPDTSAEP